MILTQDLNQLLLNRLYTHADKMLSRLKFDQISRGHHWDGIRSNTRGSRESFFYSLLELDEINNSIA